MLFFSKPTAQAGNANPDDWLSARRFSVLLAILVLAAYPQVVLGLQTFVYRDFGIFSYPLAHYFRESFWRGEIPLWNPLNNCGVPFLAQWNTQVLYPPALFYLVLGASIPLLYLAHQPLAAFAFAITFGFSMGADYMLIPLVTAERFGLASLGKLLALIIMGYTIGQWIAPWMAGRIFDTYHSYRLAWAIFTGAGLLGAAAIYAVSSSSPSSYAKLAGSAPE